MSKTLWHTITIKVPAEMVEMTKAGKVSIKKTLTKTLNISKSNKKPSIKLVPANVKAPEIVNNGKEWNVEELKKSMLKAKALSIKNKDRDIFESKDPFKNKNKFEATVAKRAKELVKIKKDKDAKISILEARIDELTKDYAVAEISDAVSKSLTGRRRTTGLLHPFNKKTAILEYAKTLKELEPLTNKKYKSWEEQFKPTTKKQAKEANDQLEAEILKSKKEKEERYNKMTPEEKIIYNTPYRVTYKKKKGIIFKEQELPTTDVENIQIISSKLQHLLFIKGIDKTKKALTKLNYNGRLHTNPMLRTARIVQNFNTIPKMKQLIKELESDI